MKRKVCDSCPQGPQNVLERQTNEDTVTVACDRTYHRSVSRRNGHSTKARPPKGVCLSFFIANYSSLVLQESFKIQGPWEATLRQRMLGSAPGITACGREGREGRRTEEREMLVLKQ